MSKAIEVLIDEKRVALLQARGGKPVGMNIGNMSDSLSTLIVRALGSDSEETWYWQLPEVADGQTLSLRVVEAEGNDISKPDRIDRWGPEEIENIKIRVNDAQLINSIFLEQADDKKDQDI